MNPSISTASKSEVNHHDAKFHATSYFKFLRLTFRLATEETWTFYVWMFVLTCVFIVGAHAWATQVAGDVVVTGMTDHVSWGALYC